MNPMKWRHWYAVKSYLKSSLWIVPIVAVLIEQMATQGRGK